METVDNALFLDLEFTRGLHSTLLPRPGAGHSGKLAKGSLSSPWASRSSLTLALTLSICLPGGLGSRRRSLESFEGELFGGSLTSVPGQTHMLALDLWLAV